MRSVSDSVLVEVVRGGFVESVHRGSLVIVDSDGTVLQSIGDPDAVILPRSAVKHAQATASLDSGATVTGELLALAASSHSGEPFHIDGVQRILSSVNLTFDDLGCPPELPGEVALPAWFAAGRGPAREAMNCSGKHATMLAACVASGWSTHDYLDPVHPLQQHVREVIEDLTGETVRDPEVDGCGAPLFGMTLTGLARLESRVVTSPEGSHARAVADAVRAYPLYASGTDRDVAVMMHAVPGLITKEGAEGVQVGALPDGRAFAVKIADGSMRARTPVTIAILRALGVPDDQLDALAELARPALLGGGKRVGELRVSAAVEQFLQD